MRIEVLDTESISDQARIYAEYRLFAALSQVVDTDRVRHACLILGRTKHNAGSDAVSCTITVDIKGGDTLRIRTTGDHPYAAINRAVERLKANRWPPRADGHSRVAHAVAE